MNRGRGAAAAVLVLAFLSLLAGGAAAEQTRHVDVGDTDTVTASVSNPLDVPDVLRLEFNGDAVSSGIIGVELPLEDRRLDCSQEEQVCEVALEPSAERGVEFSITGRHSGSGVFMVAVASETTGKMSEAAVSIEVGSGQDDFMRFLERLLGII